MLARLLPRRFRAAFYQCLDRHIVLLMVRTSLQHPLSASLGLVRHFSSRNHAANDVLRGSFDALPEDHVTLRRGRGVCVQPH
jgi:hypothetical protein